MVGLKVIALENRGMLKEGNTYTVSGTSIGWSGEELYQIAELFNQGYFVKRFRLADDRDFIDDSKWEEDAFKTKQDENNKSA
jgi:hypothetical protein